jgi:hypothetical protein
MRRTREQRGFNHLALPALLTLAALLAFTARADFRYEYTGQLLEGTYGFDGETVAGQTGPISLRLSLEDSYVPGTPFSIDFVTGLALLEPNEAIDLGVGPFIGVKARGQMPALRGAGAVEVFTSAGRFQFFSDETSGVFEWSVDETCPPSRPDCDTGGYFGTGVGGPWVRVLRVPEPQWGSLCGLAVAILFALRAYGAGSGARCTPAPVERTPHRISGVVWLSFGDAQTNSL